MVKVCHITSAHNSDDDRIFQKECVSVAKAGYDTYLVAKGESREEKGVHVIGIGEGPSSRIKRMLTFSKKIYLKALEIDADIYHLHDPELLPFCSKLKKAGKIVVFDSHENYPSQILEKKYLPKVGRTIVSKLFYKYETRVMGKIDTVIVPCTFDGKNIFEKRAKNTVYVANYPLLEDFFEKYDSAVKKKYAICYCGGLSYQRGIYHLVKAAGLAKHKLLLAGGFSSEQFEREVRELPGFSYTEYVGTVPTAEVEKLVQQSVIGANTLLNEGQYDHMDTFGVKVYEYMSLGVPVLLADNAYSRKILDIYKFGVCVDPKDPEAIAEEILRLLNNPEKAEEMGRNGRKAVEQEFNWSTQEKELKLLYEQLINNSK